jgi:hypothetical protein
MIPECVFKIRLKRDIHFSLRLSFSCDSNISGFVSDFNSIFWNAIYFWSVGLNLVVWGYRLVNVFVAVAHQIISLVHKFSIKHPRRRQNVKIKSTL